MLAEFPVRASKDDNVDDDEAFKYYRELAVFPPGEFQRYGIYLLSSMN